MRYFCRIVSKKLGIIGSDETNGFFCVVFDDTDDDDNDDDVNENSGLPRDDNSDDELRRLLL